ncbi:hypothetical protein ACFL6E_03810 [Candidatus Neomarinimicrobiota bacterium]
MGTISLQNLKPGMVLAADIVENHGQVLLTAGSTVAEKHINIFKTWGISEADIENIDADEIAISESLEIDPELLSAAQERADKLFQFNNLEFPATKKLMQMFIKFEVSRLAQKAAKS